MKDICNMGLGKLGASRVNNLSPPISTLEVKCAAEYPQWKASELRKRRWVFATVLTSLSALTEPAPAGAATDGRVFKFQKPGDLLRAIRPKNCTWVQRGEFFYDFQNTIVLEYIRNTPDSEVTDASFVELLACRVAVECAELATQSPTKKQFAVTMLVRAEEEAGRLNAFVLDPHDVDGDDGAFTWDNARVMPEFSGEQGKWW
jgi:hypothetical protein